MIVGEQFDEPVLNGDDEMWQPDFKLDAVKFPTGGVAPGTHDLARHDYVERSKALGRLPTTIPVLRRAIIAIRNVAGHVA